MLQPRTVLLVLLMLSARAYAAGEPLLQPEAFASEPNESLAVETPFPPEEQPILTEVRPIQPALSQPAHIQPTQAVEEVVPPPSLEPTPAQRPAPTSVLSRPIGMVSIRAAADPRLVEQMEKVPEQFAIKNTAEETFGSWEAPAQDLSFVQPRHALAGYHFAAPAAYSRPLYFEQENLERYGHHIGWCGDQVLAQSFVSSAHFFATAAVLPYKMGAELPDECSYVLGTYRPGSCNPHQLQHPRKSLRGLLWQGAAVTGLVFLIP